MNIMLISVMERRQEIGIRMALGARGADIRWMFVAEAVLLAIAGGVLGTLIGVASAATFAAYSNWAFVLSPIGILLGLSMSAMTGLFFGFYPASQAARLNPVDALRGNA